MGDTTHVGTGSGYRQWNNLCSGHLSASMVMVIAVTTECGQGREDGVDEEDEPGEKRSVGRSSKH